MFENPGSRQCIYESSLFDSIRNEKWFEQRKFHYHNGLPSVSFRRYSVKQHLAPSFRQATSNEQTTNRLTTNHFDIIINTSPSQSHSQRQGQTEHSKSNSLITLIKYTPFFPARMCVWCVRRSLHGVNIK